MRCAETLELGILPAGLSGRAQDTHLAVHSVFREVNRNQALHPAGFIKKEGEGNPSGGGAGLTSVRSRDGLGQDDVRNDGYSTEGEYHGGHNEAIMENVGHQGLGDGTKQESLLECQL